MAQARLQAAQGEFKSADLDFVLIGPSADMAYLIGRSLPLTERFNALIIPHKGQPIVIVPSLQQPLVSDLAIDCQVVIWNEVDDPIHLVASIIGSARRVGFNAHFWASFLLPLQALVTSASFVSASEQLGALRVCKHSSEVAILDDLATRFDSIWSEFCSGRVIGLTEHEIALRIADLARSHGFANLAWCDVGSGPNGASPLHHWSDRRIEVGDPIVIDFAATRDGYYMDTCRTPVAGEPHPEFVQIYDIVNRAYEQAAKAIRPGVEAQSVDAAARAVISDAGYGDFFIHRVGHGLGMDAHEQPYLVNGNRQLLETGMVCSNEPGIYVPGRWGVRTENIMLVTEDGTRSLSNFSRDLVVLN